MSRICFNYIGSCAEIPSWCRQIMDIARREYPYSGDDDLSVYHTLRDLADEVDKGNLEIRGVLYHACLLRRRFFPKERRMLWWSSTGKEPQLEITYNS